MKVETIAIVNKDAKSGFTRINKADFDPDNMKEFKGKGASAPDPKDESNEQDLIDLSEEALKKLNKAKLTSILEGEHVGKSIDDVPAKTEGKPTNDEIRGFILETVAE